MIVAKTASFFFSRTLLNEEPVVLDWVAEKVVMLDGWNLRVIDFRKNFRKRPDTYNSIMRLMEFNYFKKEDQDNVFLKRTFMNNGTKWLTRKDLLSGVSDNWWRVKFPSYYLKSYLSFQFWNSAFASGITANPIKIIITTQEKQILANIVWMKQQVVLNEKHKD